MDKKNQSFDDRGQLRGIIFLEIISVPVWLAGIFFFYLPLPRSSATITRLAGEENIYDIFSIMVSVILALALFYWLRRKRALAKFVSFLLGIMIYNFLTIFTEPLVALTIAVLLVYIERNYRSFVSNNFLLVIGIFCAAISFTNYYKINWLLLLLLVFSLYDIVGVFFIKTVAKVAKSAAKTGMPLVLLAPQTKISWWQNPTPEITAAIVGAGDLFIPLVFLSSVSIQYGWRVVLCSLVGAILGNVGNLFLARKIKTGIPAIPFLAVGLALGYFIGIWIF
jgi:presenilin-like A22 family membrane protease